MIPRDLSVFHSVVLTGSIRKASQEMGVAPSSISRKILVIERQFGTKLFDRSSKGLCLTHAGQLVADYARTAVLDFESLRADLDDVRGVRRRLIHIAVVESFAVGQPVAAVARFRQKFEGVAFRFTIVPAPQVSEIVSRGECDLGIAFCPSPDPKITVLERVSEPIVVAVKPGHALAKLPIISLAKLAQHSVALPETSFRVRKLFDQACHQYGIEIVPTFTANTFESLRDYVRMDAGVAVLPRASMAREEKQGELIGIQTDVESLNRTTVDIIVRKNRLPRVVKLFANELREVINSH